MIPSMSMAQELVPLNAPAVLDDPRPLVEIEELGRAPLSNYGSLEPTIEVLRANRPLDLNSELWHAEHPHSNYEAWTQQARAVLAHGLHYDPRKLELNATKTARWETDEFVRETIEFNTAPWFRKPGYFYTPKNVPLPAFTCSATGNCGANSDRGPNLLYW